MGAYAITRYRGDTIPNQIAVKDSAGAVINITGYTFLLTVNKKKEPTDITDQLFQIAGVIVDAPNGLVKFTPSVPQSNQVPGKYFYDVQMTDAGGLIQTLFIDTYTFKQDITK